MKALNKLVDRALTKIVTGGTAHAVEIICADGCGSRSATFRVINNKLYFDRCGC